MSSDALIERLIAASDKFVTPLRMGMGFNEHDFLELCRILDECAKSWKKSDVIPKKAAILLVDLFPSIEASSYLYKDGEDKRILKAADTISDMIRYALSD